jgi:5-formyltetrahydrofolate cyclo-ligase
MSLRDDKRALREAVLAARGALDAQWRAQASRTIASRIVAMEGFARASVVLVTLPFRSEWDSALVVVRALADGKVVAAPRVDAYERMLRVYRIDDLEQDTEAGYRGIPEPRASCSEVALDRVDWVLVPGVAFDATGARLGYGGGYYDRLLPLVPASAPRVAGAFALQVVDVVPTAPHDIRVDCIVTEQRTFHCAVRGA